MANSVVERAQEDPEFFNRLPRFIQRQVPEVGNGGGSGGGGGGGAAAAGGGGSGEDAAETMSLEEYEELRRKQLQNGIGFGIGSQRGFGGGLGGVGDGTGIAGKAKAKSSSNRGTGAAKEEDKSASDDLAPPAWLAKENPALVKRVEQANAKLAAEAPAAAEYQRRSKEMSAATTVAMEAARPLGSTVDLPRVARAVVARDEALAAAEKRLADNAIAVDAYWKENNIGWTPGYWATAGQRRRLTEFERERVHLEAVLKPLRESLDENPKLDDHPRGKDLRQFKSFMV